MANLHKFIVTDKVSGYIDIAGDLREAGDVVFLPEHQANYFSKSSYLINGLVEYAGEAEVEDVISHYGAAALPYAAMSEELMSLYDAKFAPNKNIFPVLPIKLATGLAANVDPFAIQGADSAGQYTASRRLYVSKIGVRYTTGTAVAGAEVRTPWHLVTAGTPTLGSPSTLSSYDDTAGTYTAATNGAIAAAAPIAWAANDILIVGYTEKFSSAMFDMTVPSNQANAITAYYWTASGWKEFLDENGSATVTDYTAETAGRTLSRAAAGDKARIVWWTQPTDWITGGPNGSGASSSDYCVGIKFSGALTNLANCSVYPVLDRPIADVKLGSANFSIGDVWSYKAAAYINSFDIDGWGAAGDALYIGFEEKFDSLYIDMSANVNAAATAIGYAYWNGAAWVAMTCTDGTAAVPGTPFAQDGWITITTPRSPSDWAKCSGTDIDSNLSTTDKLYWFRINRTGGGTTTAATAVTDAEFYVPAVNTWHYFDVKNDGFVDDGERINFICMLENANVDVVEIMAIASDI